MSTERTAPHCCQEETATKKKKKERKRKKRKIQGTGPNLKKTKKQRTEHFKLNNQQEEG